MNDDAADAPATTLAHSTFDGVDVFRVEGVIDVESARTLREFLLVHVTRDDQRVVVDLSGVAFMDSSGLGALVGAWRVVRDRGALCIAGARPVVRRILSISGLDSTFRLFPDVATALTDG